MCHQREVRTRKPKYCDLLVIGSGAGGLSAAVTAASCGLKVIVIEKDATCGGATAWSGGWMWLPLNPVSQAAGYVEDPALPRMYLQNQIGEAWDAARVDAFLKAAPEMVRFFENHTELQFVSGSWIPDIHGNTSGAALGGRQLGPKPYDGRRLGKDLLQKARPQLYETSFLGMGIMAGPDLRSFLNSTRSLSSFLHVARRLSRHAVDMLFYGRGMHLVNGPALVARLMKSASNLDVDLLVSCSAVSLIKEDDVVRGAVVETSEGLVRIAASRGVVLATGGFPRNIESKGDFPSLPPDVERWALPPQSVSGDGLALGESVGGQLDSSVASPLAWCPVSVVRYRDGTQALFPHIIDRGKPGVIGVMANGRRFVNEADGYYDYVSAMLKAVPAEKETASWLICDHRFQRRYPFGFSKPFPIPVWPYLRSGYLKTGGTLKELAEVCGIDSIGLSETIAEYNRYACKGEDPEFGRGSTPFNRTSGDPHHVPNPCVAPIDKSPFYAIKIFPGSFGTFAGLMTDARARVLNAEGNPLLDSTRSEAIRQAFFAGTTPPEESTSARR